MGLGSELRSFLGTQTLCLEVPFQVSGPARLSQAPTSLRLTAVPRPPCLPPGPVFRGLWGRGLGLLTSPLSKKRSCRTQSRAGIYLLSYLL